VVGLFNKFHSEFHDMQKLVLHWYFVSSTECKLSFPETSSTQKEKNPSNLRPYNFDQQLTFPQINFRRNLLNLNLLSNNNNNNSGTNDNTNNNNVNNTNNNINNTNNNTNTDNQNPNPNSNPNPDPNPNPNPNQGDNINTNSISNTWNFNVFENRMNQENANQTQVPNLVPPHIINDRMTLRPGFLRNQEPRQGSGSFFNTFTFNPIGGNRNLDPITQSTPRQRGSFINLDDAERQANNSLDNPRNELREAPLESQSEKSKSFDLIFIIEDIKVFPKKNLKLYLEFYNNMKMMYSELSLRKLCLNVPYLFKEFDNNYLFISNPEVESVMFDSVKDNFEEILNMDPLKVKEEIAEKKFNVVKKIFCNSLYIDNNPTFIEELFWRFLISTPWTFQNYFKKDKPMEHLKTMGENGFIKNMKHYKQMIKKFHKTVDSSSRKYFLFNFFIIR
jgi:hypothetical protein